MDTNHRSEPFAPPTPPPSENVKLLYDGRFMTGISLILVGLLIAGLGIVSAYQEYSDDGIFADPDYTAAVGAVGLAGFLILIGVILVAGAHVIGWEYRKPRRH